MATNKELFTVADGILDAKEYTGQTLSSFDLVDSYAAEGCNVNIDKIEAAFIVKQCKAYLKALKTNPGHSSNFENMRLSLLEWDRVLPGLRGATAKINSIFGPVDVYFSLEKFKLVAVPAGDDCDGIGLSTLKVGRIASNTRYTMRIVAGYLNSGLIHSGYAGYKFI